MGRSDKGLLCQYILPILWRVTKSHARSGLYALKENLNDTVKGVNQLSEDQNKQVNNVSSQIIREVICRRSKRGEQGQNCFASPDISFHDLATWFKRT